MEIVTKEPEVNHPSLERLRRDELFFTPVALEEDGAVFRDDATIAKNLKELVSDEIGSASVAQIVGYDGISVVQNDYPWLDTLHEWMGRGCRIEYLFVASDPAESHSPASFNLKEALLLLSKRFPTGKWPLDIFRPKARSEMPEEAQRYLDAWKTFHFAVFDHPPQLWVETYHPMGSTSAKRCAYFKPTVAKDSRLYSVLKSRFDYIKGFCRLVEN